MRKKSIFLVIAVLFIVIAEVGYAEIITSEPGQNIEQGISEESKEQAEKQKKATPENETELGNDQEKITSSPTADLSLSQPVPSNMTIRNPEVQKYLLETEAYFQDKKYDDALAVLKKGIELYPTDSDLYICAGIIYYFAGNLEDSISNFNKALEFQSPNIGMAHICLGLMYKLTGDQEAAKDAIAKFVDYFRQNKENVGITTALGVALIGDFLSKEIDKRQ